MTAIAAWRGSSPASAGNRRACSSRTKAGANCTAWFPGIVHGLAFLGGGPHITDGEACVLRADGTSDFKELQGRARKRAGTSVSARLCAFDLLVHDGIDLMDQPLVERKAAVADLLAGQPKSPGLFVGDLPAHSRHPAAGRR